MSDLTPCPTCQSLLRIPPTATMIRCPKCKTVLAVEPADPVPPPPVAPAKPAAPPLPFGRNAPVKPVAAAPAAAPVKPVAATPAQAKAAPIRGRLAPVQTDHLDEKQPASEAEAERLRQLRKALRKLEDQEERDAIRYEEIEVQCGYGRTGLMVLSLSVYCQSIGAFSLLMGVLLSIVADPSILKFAPLLAILLGGVGLILSLAGFGYAIPGPEKARHVAAAGLVVTVLQLTLCAIQWLAAMKLPPVEVTDWSQTWIVQSQFGIVSNLPFLAEHPARFLKVYPVSAIAMLAAAMEFTRLVLVCLLTQYYAAEGKSPELGHQSMQSVSRLFWLVLLAAMFRISISFGFDWVQKEDTMALVGKGLHVIISIASIFLLALNLFWEAQVMQDVTEVTDPRRFVHEGTTLDL